jgi:cytochrome c peroxidase
MMQSRPFLLVGVLSVTWSAAAAAFEPLPDQPPVPANNPMTAEKIALGKQLFFDPRLSVDGTVSCNSCHHVMGSGSDNRPVSAGVKGQRGGRNAPTVWNAAFLSAQFWDGRAASLEEQAKGPVLNPVEMGMPSPDAVVERLKAIPGYRKQFEEVFGSVTYDHMAEAIAAYERTLITPNSPFDRYLRGDEKAISEQAVRGMKTVSELGCTGCHTGVNLAGPSLPAGQGFYQKFPTFTDNEYVAKYRLTDDLGRYQVTKNDADKHMFRVQTWRNVALTAPYFHNGSVGTLDEAVRVMAKTQLDKELSEGQVADIVAFLNTLTGEFPEQTLPRLPDYLDASLISESAK